MAVAYLMETEHRLMALLTSELPIYLGAAFIIGAALLAWFRKVSCHVWYDLFASGSVLVWLPFWYPDFRDGSPLFFYLPLYFALITALFTLVFIKKREQIEPEMLQFLQWLFDSGRFNPVLIGIFVVVGLFVKQHFLLYPVAMTLFIVRYTLASSLDE
nr:hypothetical protein [Methylomarinum sp. Ch1-1]MDP4521710.1 hypothetical protein [Methylomarinum sp. Ch1-1]